MVNEKIIKEKLSRREAHELLSLCARHFPFPLQIIREQFQKVKEDKNPSRYGGFYVKRLKEMNRIHDLFLKVTTEEKEYMEHWHIIKASHSEVSQIYKHNDKPERQDNKTSINRGNGRGYTRDIRFPSKKRKTAWKRFYKLFPGLKPEEEELDETLTKK
jgi:hypothetical protein